MSEHIQLFQEASVDSFLNPTHIYVISLYKYSYPSEFEVPSFKSSPLSENCLIKLVLLAAL